MSRCYVCGATLSEPCQAVDGEIAECPRPTPTARPTNKCPSGRAEHQMEPDWQGRSYSHMKCRWCNHREPV